MQGPRRMKEMELLNNQHANLNFTHHENASIYYTNNQGNLHISNAVVLSCTLDIAYATATTSTVVVFNFCVHFHFCGLNLLKNRGVTIITRCL